MSVSGIKALDIDDNVIDAIDDKVIDTIEEKKEDEELIKGLDDDEHEDIILVSASGDKFTINKKLAEKYSELIETALQGSEDNNDDEDKFDLKNVDSDILGYFIEIANLLGERDFKRPEKPLQSADLKECLPNFHDLVDKLDEIYLSDNGKDKIYRLTSALNYLASTELLDTLCAFIASKIKNKPINQIEEILSTDKKVSSGKDVASSSSSS